MTSNSSKRTLSLTLTIFVTLVVFLFILKISALIFVQTNTGSEFARKKLNQLVSSKVQGKFELKHFDKIGFNRIVARDLVITAPNGEKVIELHNIVVVPKWKMLFAGKIQA